MTVQHNLLRDRELTASITPIRLRSKVVPPVRSDSLLVECC
jgi:hypothetical protein